MPRTAPQPPIMRQRWPRINRIAVRNRCGSMHNRAWLSAAGNRRRAIDRGQSSSWGWRAQRRGGGVACRTGRVRLAMSAVALLAALLSSWCAASSPVRQANIRQAGIPPRRRPAHRAAIGTSSSRCWLDSDCGERTRHPQTAATTQHQPPSNPTACPSRKNLASVNPISRAGPFYLQRRSARRPRAVWLLPTSSSPRKGFPCHVTAFWRSPCC